MSSRSFFLLTVSLLAACSSAAAVPCTSDAQCTKFGAVCAGGYCRLPKNLDLSVGDLADDLTSLPDLTEADAPVDLSPIDFSPMCSTSATCAPSTPICGTSGSCRACTIDDAPACAGRARTTPRCDPASGSCASCRVANEASDCTNPMYPVCSTTDGSCRQACTQDSDCASGVCDPGFVASTEHSCAWPEEIVYVKGATSCAGATGAQNSPLCTLDSALAKIPSGGFIRVLGSTTALGQANTTIAKPYVVVGDGISLVSIQGTQVAGPPPLHLGYYPGAFTVGSGGALYLEGVGVTTAGGIATCNSAVVGGAKMSLYNVYGAALNGFGAKSVGCTLSIDRFQVNTSSGGITVTGGTIEQLSNAMLIENKSAGVYIGAGTVLPAAGLVYLTVVQNGASGMTTPGGIDCEVPTSIVNSIVQLNDGPNYGGAGGCVFSYSDTNPVASGVGNNNIAVTFGVGPTPLPNDAWDYHLRGDQGMNDECCVNKGVVVPSVTHDIDGQPRPDGPAPDIGCDEI